jgi:hypothetical protein
MRKRLRFEILWESRYGSWRREIAILLSPIRVKSRGMSRFQLLNIEGVKLSQARGLVSSVALHVAAIAIIANLSVGIRERLPLTEQAAAPAPIYIDMKALKDLKILRALPVIRALRSGGTPDSRSRSPREVLQASTVQHPKLTIIVTPLKPDNKRQAIHQQVAPPDLKIQAEQSIPDIVLVDGTAPARPQVDMSIHRPTAPEIARSPGGLSAPVVPSNAPALPMRIDSSVQQPRMPVSYFANNSLQTPRGELPPNRQEASAPPGSSADASGEILALSVDPATFSKFAALVQGNRYATLAIAPAKEGAGSPGGSPNGVSAAGLGGTGKGGDASGAVGPGHTGGSWTDEVRTATLSASGGTGKLGGVDANRILSPVLPSTIYPVAIDPKIRRVPMIISSGPMGGGGLDVYGALPCGKVYSIFLPERTGFSNTAPRRRSSLPRQSQRYQPPVWFAWKPASSPLPPNSNSIFAACRCPRKTLTR